MAKSQKMTDLGVFAKFVITRHYRRLRSRSWQQNAVLCLHFKCVLIRRWCNLRQGVCKAPIIGLLFWAFSLAPPLAKSQKMTNLGVFATFFITRLYGHLRGRSLQHNAVLCLHFKCILIRRWCNLRQGVFEAPIVGPLFWAFSLGPPLAKSQKMADLGVFAKFVITRLYGHLRSRSLQHNAVLCLHFKCILIRRWCKLRQGVCKAPIIGLLFWAFSLGPPLAKSQKMTDLGVFAKFVITRLYGHLRSRSLQQNAVLCLHFKCILIRRWCKLREGVCKAPIIGLLFWAFSLGPPLAKSQKMTDLGVFAKFVITRLYGHLRSRSLQHNAVLCLHYKCVLIRRWCNLRKGLFEAPIFGLFFWAFSLGPPWAKSQKMTDLGVFAKFVITRLYGHLRSCSLQQNTVLCLHFKCVLIRRWCNLRQGVFEAPIFDLFFWAFSRGPSWAKSQKMAVLGVFAKFVITRLYGHLRSRSLQQNAVLCLHFKCILIRRWCNLRQGVFESHIVGPLFWAFSLGPPLAKSQKMADLGVFAKFVITRLYGHLGSDSLQQNAVLCLHFKCILIRRWCNLRQGACEASIVGLLFWAFSLGPPLAKSQKIADLGVFPKFVITRLYGHQRSCSLQQNAVLCLHFKCILIRRWCNLRQGIFEAPIVGPLFWAFSLGPPLAKSQKMADLGVFAKFVITRLYGHLRSRSLQQNAVLCLHFKCILIRRWCKLRQGVFKAPIIGLLFWAFSLGPPLAKSQKMADLGVFAKFVITRLYGHLRSRSLQQNAVLCLHFKCILIRRWCNLRQGIFESPIVGPLFWAFSLGPPWAKSQKMADLGVFAKFVITRLYGHLGSDSLQQNAVLCLHFKCILIRRWCNLRQGACEASIVGLLFWAFSLGPPLAKSQKMADLGVFAKFVITRLYGHQRSCSLQQNAVLCLHFKCILIRRWCKLRQGVCKAPIIGLLFWAFSLGPPLAKSQKMTDLGVFAKFVITRLYGHLRSRSLQHNAVLCLHFKCVLIRRWCNLRKGLFEAPIFGLFFWAFSLGPPWAKSQKMTDLGVFAKFVITRLYGHLRSCSLQQNTVLCLHFKCVLISRWCNLRQGVFEAPIFDLFFWAFSRGPSWAKSQKMAVLGVFAKFVITRLYGQLRSRSLQQNAVLCLHFKCILIRRWCNLRQGVFESPIVGPLFWAFSLGPPLAKSQKMADLGVFAKFVITRLYGHLGSDSLPQNAVLCLHFKCILIRRWCNLRQGACEASIVGLLFWAFSLGPPLAKSQKMADLGVFAKFVITRLYGHQRSCSLQQNAVLCLHFKCILIRRWCNLRQGVFEAPMVGPLFWAFSLAPPLAKSQKMADLGLFAKFVITRLYGHLRSRSLQQNAVLCLHFKCVLIRRWWNLRQGVFEAPIFGLFFWAFSLGPPLAKSQKMADLGVFAKFVITRLYGHLRSHSLQ